MKEVKKVFKAETKRNSSDTDSLLQRIKVGIGVFSELSNRHNLKIMSLISVSENAENSGTEMLFLK